VVYTEFENALNQSPQTFQFLPVQPEELLDTDDEQEFEEEVEEYIFEPKPELLLDQFLPKYVNMLFYTILLESLTSEHGARMVAMRDATDNAEEKIDDLTHTYNQARQETITRELLDIVGAVNALEGEDR
jgi:F-type H+-transporting ATPase subunit gamma